MKILLMVRGGVSKRSTSGDFTGRQRSTERERVRDESGCSIGDFPRYELISALKLRSRGERQGTSKAPLELFDGSNRDSS